MGPYLRWRSGWGRRRGLTCGQVKGAGVVPAQSQCSADTARIAVGRPSLAPSAMAPHGLLEEAHPRIHSLWEPLGLQTLTQGALVAAEVEIKAHYLRTRNGVQDTVGYRPLRMLEPHLPFRGCRSLWGSMQPGSWVKKQSCRTVMHQAG